jgi:biotin carboxyl carrier protein
MKYITTVNGVDFEVELLGNGKVNVNGEEYDVDFQEVGGQLIFTLLVNGRSYEAHISQEEEDIHILLQGDLYTTQVIDEREKRLREASGEVSSGTGEFILKAPMPGLVVKVPVNENDHINQGDVLVILESMKMQNELKSPREGLVTDVKINKGDNVEKGDVLLILAPEEE